MDTLLIFSDRLHMRWSDGLLYLVPIIGFWVSAVRRCLRKIRDAYTPSGKAMFFYGGIETRERGSKKNF